MPKLIYKLTGLDQPEWWLWLIRFNPRALIS